MTKLQKTGTKEVGMSDKALFDREEEWKPIPGYEGFYEASNLGRIRSCTRMIRRSRGGLQKHRGKVLKSNLSKDGYLTVALSKKGKAKTFTVHLLIARTLIGGIEISG